jgi:hypothetical protein
VGVSYEVSLMEASDLMIQSKRALLHFNGFLGKPGTS